MTANGLASYHEDAIIRMLDESRDVMVEVMHFVATRGFVARKNFVDQEDVEEKRREAGTAAARWIPAPGKSPDIEIVCNRLKLRQPLRS